MQTDAERKRHNIILFGESGVGKSSVVNMLCGSGKAEVSDGARAGTLSYSGYEGSICGEDYMVWDTAGVNEGDQMKLPDTKAVMSLYYLLRKLSDEGGVSLLVFCMRSPRITDAGHKNWVLFRDIVCQKKVPTVVAITHLDSLQEMNTYWPRNELAFIKDYDIRPTEKTYREFSGAEVTHSDAGVACICASKGKVKGGAHVNEEEYGESCPKIQKLVFESYLPEPWKVDPVPWFNRVLEDINSGFCLKRKKQRERADTGKGVYDIMEKWGFTEERAREIAAKFEKAIQEEEAKAKGVAGATPAS